MKKVSFKLAAFTVLGAILFTACQPKKADEAVNATTAPSVSGSFLADTAASTVQWFGKKVTGEHNGTVKLKEASFVVDKGVLKSGAAIVNLTTITNSDLTNPEWNAKLIGHLASEDFFNTAKYPTASIRFQNGENGLAGDLTIKGISKPAKVEAQVGEENGKIIVTGSITIDRTEFDIRYGSGKFFENLGNNTISDEFSLKFKVVAK